VFVLVREEAAARGEDITPAHWLLALLRDAEDPVEVTAHRYPVDRRKRAMFGLPDRGPSPVRLLVEAHGLTLEQLRAAGPPRPRQRVSSARMAPMCCRP
jgi:hypothetical protein